MNDGEMERYETELRRATPAKPPEAFMARLRAGQPVPESQPERPTVARAGATNRLPPWWHWLVPATSLAVVALVVARVVIERAKLPHETGAAQQEQPPLPLAYGLKADGVRVDRELISSYDVVAQLPNGEPVRFRCQKWRDKWVVTDTNRGVEIEENSPRVEVVPVRFETY